MLAIGNTLYKDNLHNYRLLRANGVDMPGPITRTYSFPSLYPSPMPHQVATCDFLSQYDRAHCHNAIGTGKTLIIYWLVDFLKREGYINRTLVIAPLSTLESTHAKELKWSLHHLSYNVLYGPKSKRVELLAQEKDIYIINFDGVKVLKDYIAVRADIDCIIIDEIAVLRNANTQIWKLMNVLFGAHANKKLYGFSGSPMPNAPTDCYGQARLINPQALPQQINWRSHKQEPISFTKFKMDTMLKVSEWKWVPVTGWQKKCRKVLQPSIRFTREDVEPDLPAVVLETRVIPLSEAQEKAYKQMMQHCVAEVKAGTLVSAAHEGAKILKLVQISSGAIYDEAKNTHYIDCKKKLEELIDIIEQTNNHVLLAVPFVNIALFIRKELRTKRHSAECILGQRTNLNQRGKIIDFFMWGDLKVLIATPGSIPHGVNLQAKCHTTVWWGPINRYDIYEQFNGRTDRKGQSQKVLVIHFESTEVDRDIYAKLRTKCGAQGILLNLLKKGIK